MTEQISGHPHAETGHTRGMGHYIGKMRQFLCSLVEVKNVNPEEGETQEEIAMQRQLYRYFLNISPSDLSHASIILGIDRDTLERSTASLLQKGLIIPSPVPKHTWIEKLCGESPITPEEWEGVYERNPRY